RSLHPDSDLRVRRSADGRTRRGDLIASPAAGVLRPAGRRCAVARTGGERSGARSRSRVPPHALRRLPVRDGRVLFGGVARPEGTGALRRLPRDGGVDVSSALSCSFAKAAHLQVECGRLVRTSCSFARAAYLQVGCGRLVRTSCFFARAPLPRRQRLADEDVRAPPQECGRLVRTSCSFAGTPLPRRQRLADEDVRAPPQECGRLVRTSCSFAGT